MSVQYTLISDSSIFESLDRATWERLRFDRLLRERFIALELVYWPKLRTHLNSDSSTIWRKVLLGYSLSNFVGRQYIEVPFFEPSVMNPLSHFRALLVGAELWLL